MNYAPTIPDMQNMGVFSVANEWDTVVKLLIGSNPQHFVSLLLPGARFHGIVDRELTLRRIEADLLYDVEWRGRMIVLHAEFQRRRDGDMGKRIWQYNFIASYQTQLPVSSFVIYLIPDGNVPEPPYVQRLLDDGSDDDVIHIFNYRVIKLWEMAGEEIKKPGVEGMLPMLPLTRDGMRRERVEEMITRLQAVGREDLLAMAYSLAALAFKKTEDKAWLQRRFDMLKDILEESWAYQEMVESAKTQGLKEGRAEGMKEGREEGMKEGINVMREMVAHFVQKRYPQFVPLATQYINQIEEPKALSNIMDKLFDAQTNEEVAQIFSR